MIRLAACDDLRALAASQSASMSSNRIAMYQASFVLAVASWDSYINNVVDEAHTAVTGSLQVTHHAIASILDTNKERLLSKFNAPNSENTRNLFLQALNFDPWPSWNWTRALKSSLEVRTMLNETMRVRHSIAHGASLPNYPWICDSQGRPRVNSAVVSQTVKLLQFLCRATDVGIRSHLSANMNTSL